MFMSLGDVKYTNSYSCIYIHASEETQWNLSEKPLRHDFPENFGLPRPIGCWEGDPGKQREGRGRLTNR